MTVSLRTRAAGGRELIGTEQGLGRAKPVSSVQVPIRVPGQDLNGSVRPGTWSIERAFVIPAPNCVSSLCLNPTPLPPPRPLPLSVLCPTRLTSQ